jgi:hypothetical protein
MIFSGVFHLWDSKGMLKFLKWFISLHKFITIMHVISFRKLKEFFEEDPNSKVALQDWYKKRLR